MDDLAWLRENLRNNISRSAPIARSERVLRFPNTVRSAVTKDGEAALDLVYQVAEVIRGIEVRANETEKDARDLAERAIEKLQLAEKRIQELEADRRADEACINEARAKIQEAGEALRLERLRVEAAETQLCQLELRARSAEARADESENALARIEVAIRSQILGQRRSTSNKSTAAA